MRELIATEDDHATALGQLSELAEKQEHATPEEVQLMKLLTALLQEYERKRWPRKRQKSTPAELLAFLLEENGLKQGDLAGIAPQPNISAILSGKREISKPLARKLAKRFGVPAELFLF